MSGFVETLKNPWVMLAVIAVLIAYRILASRSQRIPVLPIGLLTLYLALDFAYRIIPESFNPRLSHWIDTIAVISLYCAAFRIIFALTVELWLRWRRRTRLPKLTKDFILVSVYAVIIFLVLSTKGGVNLAGLITTSAVLTAVVGLAAQSSLGNLFAGLSLQMERPYAIGDWLQYGDRVGRVVGIGWKSTRLMTFESEIIYVPNAEIIKNVVTNFSKPSRIHTMAIDLGVEYGAAPNDVRRVILDTLREEPRILKVPKPLVRLTVYGDFAITYQIRFTYEDFGVSPELRGSVMNRLWYALARNDIKIPFPIRVVHHRHIERDREIKQLKQERALAREELDSVPILAPLAPDSKERLAQDMRLEAYADGETVVWEGDEGDSMYIIHSGSCQVLVGKDAAIPVATLTPPSFFGEMSLLTGEPRSATVRARGDSTLFAIDKELFAEIMEEHPEITDQLAQALAARQADTAKKLEEGAAGRTAQVQGLTKRIRSFFGLK